MKSPNRRRPLSEYVVLNPFKRLRNLRGGRDKEAVGNLPVIATGSEVGILNLPVVLEPIAEVCYTCLTPYEFDTPEGKPGKQICSCKPTPVRYFRKKTKWSCLGCHPFANPRNSCQVRVVDWMDQEEFDAHHANHQEADHIRKNGLPLGRFGTTWRSIYSLLGRAVANATHCMPQDLHQLVGIPNHSFPHSPYELKMKALRLRRRRDELQNDLAKGLSASSAEQLRPELEKVVSELGFFETILPENFERIY